MNINSVMLQHDREFIMFRFYFSLFMVLLYVIFNSIWYSRTSFWVLLHAMFIYDRKQAAQWLELRERLLTITKINIIRWNVYRDNNFHSRRQVLRVKCLWKSSVRNAWAHKLYKQPGRFMFMPASRCLLFFKMNSRQENRSDLSFYSQNHN